MNIKPKSIVVLGAAALQVPLIEYVKNKGYRVVVVSIPGDYPGFDIADRCIFKDVREGKAILEELSDENVVAVLTDQTDLSVPTVSYLTQKMGLPGNKEETASAYSNKYRMRQVCVDAGVPVPSFISLSSLKDLDTIAFELKFPVVMKPEDNQGSRGIYVAHTKEEIVSLFHSSQSFSKTGRVIVEEYFSGREVVVEGFVADGVYLNWGIADRKYLDIKDLFIPSQTIFPTTLSNDIQDSLIATETRLHDYLHPQFGMIHSEYIVDEQSGKFILVETALRGGGVYISSLLVPLYTNYNNYDLLFDYSIGKKRDINKVRELLEKKSSAYICFYLPIGVINKIDGIEELLKIPGVVKVDVDNLYIGKQISKIQNKTMRFGPIIVKGDNRKEVETVIKKIKDTLNITVITSDGTIGNVIWE